MSPNKYGIHQPLTSHMIVETQQRYVNHSSDVTHDVAVNHMICEN
ncbi:hypothetical protein LCGC14_2742480, partial [marine sediment metagenome]